MAKPLPDVDIKLLRREGLRAAREGRIDLNGDQDGPSLRGFLVGFAPNTQNKDAHEHGKSAA